MSRNLTLEDLLAAGRPGEPTAGEVLEVLDLSNEALLAAAAAALRDDSPAWRRRLLAWRLERLREPARRRPGPRIDPAVAVEYLEHRQRGATHREAVESMLVHPDADTRAIERKVARAKRELARPLRAHLELLDGAVRAMDVE